MEKGILTIAILICFSAFASAQTSEDKLEAVQQKVEMRPHKCTEGCHTSGHCVFAHSETGHSCSETCKKATNILSNTDLKDHVCTKECHTSGHCVFAHGEKGHTCTETCKNNF